MNSATPTATGVAMIRAISELSTVPKARAPMPKTGLVAFGWKVSSVRKWEVLAWRAGTALTTRNTPIAAMIARRATPAASEAKRKGTSPRLRRKADRPRAGPLFLEPSDVAISLGDRLDSGADLGDEA